MMRLTAALEGNLDEFVKREEAAFRRATSGGVSKTSSDLQAEIRARTRSALKRNVAGAVRRKVYPANDGGDPAAIVYSKLGRGKGSQFVDYLGVLSQGTTIRPVRGKFLVIPVKGASRRTKRYLRDLANVETDSNLQLIPLRQGGYMLVRQTKAVREGRGTAARGYGRTTLIARLVPRATLPRKINLADLPARYSKELEREISREFNEQRAA